MLSPVGNQLRQTLVRSAFLSFLALACSGPAAPPSPSGTSGGRAYARLCAGCHGDRGQGGGPGGPIDAKGHAHQHSDAYLANLIAKGNGFPDPRTNMPGFAGQVSEQETAEMLAFIKALWTQEQRAFQDGLNKR